MIFSKEQVLEFCNQFSKNTLMQTLQIEYIDAGEDFLVAKMPVTPAVHQPMGILHGGASVALANWIHTQLFRNLIENKVWFAKVKRNRLIKISNF